MARTVNVAFNFMTSDAVNNVNKLNQVLKSMNKEVKKVEKPIKLDVISSEAEDKIKSLEKKLKQLGENVSDTNDIMGNFGLSFLANEIGSRANALILKYVDSFMKLENAIYSLKVVAGDQAPNITRLRTQMLNLASDGSFTAVELSKAMDSVMRMGLSYKDSMNIVQASSKLALASGDGLGDAVNIMNKLIVSLGVNSAYAEEATQSLHATSVSTATDLAGLGTSAKQWAGAMSTLANTTSKSGRELGQYRMELLEIGNGLSGILANMGKCFAQPIKLISKRCA